MKIITYTSNSTALKNAINKKINDKELKTWEIVRNNKNEILYSHIPEQWKEKAMLKPCVYDDRVEFVINWWNKKGEPDEETKGYILGRFVEILMVHFKSQFIHLKII